VCVCSFGYPACKAHAPYYIAICGFFKNPQTSHYMKICPVGVKLFHADRHDKANTHLL